MIDDKKIEKKLLIMHKMGIITMMTIYRGS